MTTRQAGIPRTQIPGLALFRSVPTGSRDQGRKHCDGEAASTGRADDSSRRHGSTREIDEKGRMCTCILSGVGYGSTLQRELSPLSVSEMGMYMDYLQCRTLDLFWSARSARYAAVVNAGRFLLA